MSGSGTESGRSLVFQEPFDYRLNRTLSELNNAFGPVSVDYQLPREVKEGDSVTRDFEARCKRARHNHYQRIRKERTGEERAFGGQFIHL